MLFKRIFLVKLLAVLALATVVEAQESLLNGVLRVIFANIFKPNSMSVTIIANISGREDFKSNLEILDPLLHANQEIQVPVVISEYTTISLMHYVQAKLIFSNSAQNVKMGMENHNNETLSISTKYIIILTCRDPLEIKLKEMHAIFKNCLNLYIIDVVILVHVEDALNMYTYKPYSSEQCASSTPLLVQQFKTVPQLLEYQDLFPEKANNFHQCPMRVVLYHIPPLVTLTHGHNDIHIAGLEAEILKDLATHLNFTIKVVPNEPKDYISGIVFRNKTATGVFKILTEGRANLSIGLLGCEGKRRYVTTASMPYLMDEIVIVLKKSQKYTPIELLLRPFCKQTWYFLITLIVLRKLLTHRLFKHLNSKFLNLLKLHWLFLFFIFRISYEGSMFKAVQTSAYHPLPQTLDELVQQNYTIFADYATSNALRDMAFLRKITTNVPGSPSSVLESIDDLPQKAGVLSHKSFLSHFMMKRQNCYYDYATVHEKVSNTLICVYFPRFSFMASSVNNQLILYGRSGLIQKFLNEHDFLPMTTDQTSDDFNRDTKTSLDFNFLKKIFWYLTMMNIVAVIVFLLELLSPRCKLLNYIFTSISKYQNE